MRILLDECVPRRFRLQLPEHEVRTAPEMGWASLKNGVPLSAASGKFDVLLSTTPAQRATPPQLRRGAFTNSPPDSGGAGASATGVVTSCPYRVTYLPVDREGFLFFSGSTNH
jgi:hypothetical protein